MVGVIVIVTFLHDKVDRRGHTTAEPQDQEEAGHCVGEHVIAVIAQLLNTAGHDVDPEEVPQEHDCVCHDGAEAARHDTGEVADNLVGDGHKSDNPVKVGWCTQILGQFVKHYSIYIDKSICDNC